MQRFASNTGDGLPPQDATIDIPLAKVQTGGIRSSKIVEGSEKMEQYEFRRGDQRRPRHHLKENDIEGVNSMGKLYHKIYNSSIIVRYFLYIIPIGIILTIPIVVGALVRNPGPPGIGGVRIVWIFAWGLTSWVALWASKLMAKALPYLFLFLCGIVSPGTRKYSNLIKALEIPISLFLWALTSLATFRPVLTMNPSPYSFSTTGLGADDQIAFVNNWIDIVTQVLAAILTSAGIYLAEKTLIQLISVSYHRMQYENKIKESKHNVHVLSMLYDASTAQFAPFCQEFLIEDYEINDISDFSRSRKGHIYSGAASPMKILANINRAGGRITAAFGNIAHEVTGKEVFNPTSAHSVVVQALEKKRSSEALARRIWMSLVSEGQTALCLSDLIEVLVDHAPGVPTEVFEVLDSDGNGDITLDEMVLKVCDIGQTRKSIASSLLDVDQAINVLDNLLLTVALVVVVFVFVAFLNTSFVTTLATAGTVLLSLSFVFSATAQEVLGSCIFLFVKHPFDIGDVVVVSSQQLVVEKISLLYTVFKSTATHTTSQCSNLQLNGLWIDNVTRSKSMRETLTIDVSFDTTLEDLELFRREMQMFVRDDDNIRDYESDIEVDLTSINSMEKLQLEINIKYKSNWSNGTVTAARRAKFMCALVLALRKVPIYGPGGGKATLGSVNQPSYTVNVTDEEAAAARAAFDKSKAEQRLKTYRNRTDRADSNITPQPDAASFNQRSAPIGPPSETQALTNLTTRAPTQDDYHDWQTADHPTSIRRRPLQAFAPRDKRISDAESGYRSQRSSQYGKRRRSGTSRDSINSSLRPPRIDEPITGGDLRVYQQHINQAQPGASRSPTIGSVHRTGEAGQHNPYVQTTPVYEHPPGRTLQEEDEAEVASVSKTSVPPVASPTIPLPPIPVASNQPIANLHELDADKKSVKG